MHKVGSLVRLVDDNLPMGKGMVNTEKGDCLRVKIGDTAFVCEGQADRRHTHRWLLHIPSGARSGWDQADRLTGHWEVVREPEERTQ